MAANDAIALDGALSKSDRRSTLSPRDARAIHTLLVGLAMTWGIAVCGIWAWYRYEATPAAAVEASPRWPANPSLSLGAEHPTLVMTVHPLCPCTRASLRVLERIVARVPGVDVRVLFAIPKGLSEDPQDSELWSLVERIPGATPVVDQGGQLTKRFHTSTSGTVVVYSPQGDLVFEGGITGARGHEGANDGATALVNTLERGPVRHLAQTPVFGCSIFGKGASDER